MEIQNNNLQKIDNPKSPQLQNTQKEPRYKSYWHVMLIVINTSLSNFYFGYCLVYISTVDFAVVISVWDVPFPFETARGILTGCIPVGALIGALMGKKLIHLFSRRNFILLINACGIVAGSLLYITHVESFIIMRLIQGACIGLYTAIIPIVIAEISPLKISGSTGAFTQIFCSVGTTMAYLFYYILSVALPIERNQEIWYYVFGLPLVTLVIQTIILLFVFPYETPKYYLLHHRKAQARELIAKLYKPEYVDIILHEKIEDLSESLAKEKKVKQKASKTNKVADQTASNNNFPPRMQSVGSVNSALAGEESEEPQTAKISIFASIHLNILRQFVGINAIVAYAGSIIKQAIPGLKAVAPIILMLETMVGAIFSIYLLHKFGRKTIIQYGTIILSASLFMITVGFFIIDQSLTAGSILIIIGMVVYMFVFGATLGSTIWLYTAEICEPSYIILATAVTWIFASVVIILFPILKNMIPNKSPVYLFLFFFIWTTLSFIVNHKVLLETKEKTQHQIHDEYKLFRIFGKSKTIVLGSPAQQEKDQKDQHEDSGIDFKINHNEHQEEQNYNHQDHSSSNIIKTQQKEIHPHNLEPINHEKKDEIK